jgi:NB-ARC domain
MLANDDSVRQLYRDGIIWVELGETASSGALIEQLAHAVKRSVGEKTADLVTCHMNADKFELSKAEFRRWFDNRKVVFVLDNICESKDRTFNRWIDVLREIPGNKSFLLCSSRTPLGEKNIEFNQLKGNEETAIFLKHLQLQPDSREYLDKIDLAARIVGRCAGLPLALAMAAGYLRRDPNGWKTLSERARKEITAERNPNFTISGHTGLPSVFKTSFEWLVRERTPPRDCSYSWAELYTSLCVLDPASPGLPLCVLSLMWGMCVESAQELCQAFVSLSLATLSADDMEKRMVKLHDLQLDYCVEQCARTRTPSHNSAQFLVSKCTWHLRIIEGLLAKAAVQTILVDSADEVLQRGAGSLQAGAATADAVVEPFIGLAEDSALAEYFLKNLVRHICGIEEESLVMLAIGVLSDYRWLLAVCRCQSLSFAASQYSAVVNCVRDWRQNNERSKGSEVASEFGRELIRDLEGMADILRL